ncbi:unnamed protein product [Adineta ricciae]|uniref:F-box domain-containing protein n=1 Tax=Adineta ricciae TaxID=249248 RepID=A0A813UXM5_ADIRI|nr:unnamed protein product [Adineta ricciae]
MHTIANLESLPDELLLEICKYLLCVDVLLCFDNLNHRFTCLVNDYRRHVSLHKASYAQSFQLCTDILPRIGAQIQTLVIDNCYSALQAIAFPKYFQHSMSTCFPDLKKIILVSFRPDPLFVFLKTLNHLDKLQTIDMRSLFRVPTNQQTEVLLALLQANNSRLTSVLIDDQSSHLNPIKKYLPTHAICSNILHLKIEILTICDLAVLFTIIPNVHTLFVSIHKNDNLDRTNRKFKSETLYHLTHFQLKSIEHSWYLNELRSLLDKLPAVEYLSLNLRTSDVELTSGQILQNYLPNKIKQFHYAIHYLPEQITKCSNILETWESVYPIRCLYDVEQNDYMFLHTIPYLSFDYLEISSSVASAVSKHSNSFENVLRVHVDCDFTLTEAFPIISCCRRAKHSMIWLHGTNRQCNNHEQLTQEQTHQKQADTLPKLPRLRRLTLVGLPPKDLHHMSTILLAAPNLFRLDLNYNTLLLMLADDKVCSILRQRITALTINHMQASSRYVEENIARIALIFLHLRHLYVDMRSLEMTIDMMVLYYFDEFVKQNAPLVSLCADGKPSDEMKLDAKKWLLSHRQYLNEKQLAVYFNEKAGRLLIWM